MIWSKYVKKKWGESVKCKHVPVRYVIVNNMQILYLAKVKYLTTVHSNFKYVVNFIS